jgi:septal ring factor EnvC (AmiA/AmiB activator)
MLTKSDLEKIEKIIAKKSQGRILTEKDIEYLEQRLGESFVSKSDLQQTKSDLIDILSDILKEIRDMRDEKDVLSHQVASREDRINQIESNLGIAS